MSVPVDILEEGSKGNRESMHQVASITLIPVGDPEIPWANLDSFLPTLSPELSVHIFPEKSKWHPSQTTHSVPRVLVLPDAVCLLSLFPSSPRILDIFRSPLHQAHYPAKLDLGSTTLLSYFLSAPRSPSVLQLPCYLISVHCARLLKWLLCRLQVIALILHILQHLAGWAGMEIDFAIHGSFFNPFVIIQLSNQGVGGGNQIHSHSVLRLCISNHSSGFLSFPQVPVPFET